MGPVVAKLLEIFIYPITSRLVNLVSNQAIQLIEGIGSMILHRRPNVRWSGISPEMVLAITIIKDIGLSMQLPVIITSCRDGKHSTKSKHYSGHAIDIAIRDYSEEQLTALVQHLQRNLGEDFDIVIEDAGGPNEHMHIEYDPKNLMLQKDNPPG